MFWSVMRLVLVNAGSDRVCGDSAAFAARSAEWAENAFRDVRIEDMALIAARLLDEREGNPGWRYQFDPLGTVDGMAYDVFLVNEDAEALPQVFDESSFPALVIRSQFVGHIRRSPPLLRLPDRRAAAPSRPADPARRGERQMA